MKSRLLASVVLGTAVVLTATGCNMLAPQATTLQYNPGDGMSVNTGTIQVLNALVISEDGEDGNLVVAFYNKDEVNDATILIEYGENGIGGEAALEIPAGTLVSLGGDEEGPLLLEGIDTQPGGRLPMYFRSGDGEGQLVLVPVLDGSLPYYADLVP